MLSYRGYISFAFALIAVSTSNIQATADEKTNFSKLVEDAAERLVVLTSAKQSPVLTHNPCASENFTNVNRFAIYTPVEFDSSGKIIAGAWKQSVSESGCGQERLLNVVVFFDTKNNILKAIPLLPGTTKADFTLQNDAITYAIIAASRPTDPDNTDPYVIDTEFLHETGEALEGAKGKPWDELWTLSICGKTAQVTMHFIPDKTGTTINTSLAETKFLPSK